jgi:ADP-ribose pyrophosphatase
MRGARVPERADRAEGLALGAQGEGRDAGAAAGARATGGAAGRDIYKGRVVHLRVEPVALPGGPTIELEVIRHPGASAVVPLDWNGEVLLIKQYRHAAGGFIYEVPAGKLDASEPPEACAARELIEEAGVEAGRIDRLGAILTTPGFTDEVIHLFLARELVRAEQRLEVDEVLSVERVPLARAIAMCAGGEIRDAKTLCALFLADRFLHEELRAAGT